MPRKPYFDQRRFNEGWSENNQLNRYRSACKKMSITGSWFPVRYWEGGEWSPHVIERTWFTIANPLMKPLIHNGKKAR